MTHDTMTSWLALYIAGVFLYACYRAVCYAAHLARRFFLE